MTASRELVVISGKGGTGKTSIVASFAALAELTRHFDIPTMVCINKWDLNEKITAEIETRGHERGLKMAGRIRYDRAVTEAQVRSKSVVQHQNDGCVPDIRQVWSEVSAALEDLGSVAATEQP